MNKELKSSTPLDQFTVKKIFNIEFFGSDLSINSLSVILFVSFLISCFLFSFGAFCNVKKARSAFLFSSLQIFSFFLYDKISGIFSAGNKNLENTKIAHLMTAFGIFIGVSNLLGMFLFSAAAHFSFSITLGFIVFLTSIGTSIKMNGLHFYSIFIPSGTPNIMKPLMFVIELFSYFIRPITLGMRLSANIIAGHVMLSVISSFFNYIESFAKFTPFLFVFFLSIFEAAIGVFQAYIFLILSSTYLRSAVLNEH